MKKPVFLQGIFNLWKLCPYVEATKIRCLSNQFWSSICGKKRNLEMVMQNYTKILISQTK